MAEIIAGLRDLGHDVVAIIETAPSVSDSDVLANAASDARILITEDKDFGDLVVRHEISVNGIVLLQLRRMSPSAATNRAVKAITENADKLSGHFVVVEASRLRSRPL